MESDWTKEIKRLNSMCRLNNRQSEMYVREQCKFFTCPSFRTNNCMRQSFLAGLSNIDNTSSSQSWINDSEYMIQVAHYGENADEVMMNILDEFKYTLDSTENKDRFCGFGFEMLSLQQDVLAALKKALK